MDWIGIVKPREGRFFFRSSTATVLHEVAPSDRVALCGVRIGPNSVSETIGLPSIMCQKCYRKGEWRVE